MTTSPDPIVGSAPASDVRPAVESASREADEADLVSQLAASTTHPPNAPKEVAEDGSEAPAANGAEFEGAGDSETNAGSDDSRSMEEASEPELGSRTVDAAALPRAAHDAIVQMATDRGRAYVDEVVDAFTAEIRSVRDSIQTEMIDAQAQVFADLLENWAANINAQMAFLERWLRQEHPVDRVRSELARVQRDLMRWLRQLCEIADVASRTSARHERPMQLIDQLIRSTNDLPVVTAAASQIVFAVEPDDRWWRRLRKARALRQSMSRSIASRVVELEPLADTFVVAPLMEKMPWVVNLVGSLRLFVWRRIRHVAMTLSDTFARADKELAAGRLLAVTGLAGELVLGVDMLNRDTLAFADEVKHRIHRTVEEQISALLENVARAGTFLLPRRRYAVLDERVSIRVRDTITSALTRWGHISHGTSEAAATLLDGEAFLAAVRYAHFRDAHHLAQHFAVCALPVISVLRESVTEELSALQRCFAAREATPASALRLSQQVEESNGRLRTSLDEHLPSQDVIRAWETSLLAVLEGLRTSVRKAVRRVGARFDVVNPDQVHVAEGEMPPEPILHEVPFRTIAESMVIREIDVHAESHAKRIAEAYQRFARGLDEVDRMVRYNLDTAERELTDTGVDGAQAYAIEGLERVVERCDALSRDMLAAREELVASLTEAAPDALAEFDAHLRDLDSAILDEFDTSAIAAENRITAKSKLDRVWLRLRQPVIVPSSGVRSGIYDIEDVAAALEGASMEAAGIGVVPHTYIRLFLGDKENARTFHVADSGLHNMWLAQFAAWQQGTPTAIAVVGLNGAGKGSAISRFVDDCRTSVQSVRSKTEDRITSRGQLAAFLSTVFGLPVTRDLDSVQVALERRPFRTVAFLEDAEMLFARTVGGFEALKALLTLISETEERVLWVVTFETVAFDFLETVLHLRDAFTHVMDIAPLDRDAVEQLVLTRHRVSGLRLRFVAEDEADPVVAYFDALAGLSMGHPTLVLYYWLSSIQELNPRGEVVVGPIKPIPEQILQPLPGLKLASLATLMLHGGLTRAAFARLMRLQSDEAATVLSRLRHINLVESEGHIFRVNRVVYRHVVRELTARSVL